MITFIGYTLTVVFALFFLCYIRKLKADLKRAEILLESSNLKLLEAKRDRMHYKVAAELLMEEKNPRNTRANQKSAAPSRGTSADFGLPRRSLGSSRQTSDDSSIFAATSVGVAGSSYDYESSSDSSCDSSSSYSGSCD